MATKQPKSLLKSFQNWYRKIWIPSPGKPPHSFICVIGDPVLRTKCSPVDVAKISSPEIKKIISKMKSVMKKEEAVGLAAPQIGCSVQILAFQFTKKMLSEYHPNIAMSREIEVFPFKIFINPELKVTNNKKVNFPEMCASINGYSGVVPRYLEVNLTGLDENAKPITWQARGWAARIVQHEMDHLNGQFYTDFMDPKTFVYEYWFLDKIRKRRWYFPFFRIKTVKYKHE